MRNAFQPQRFVLNYQHHGKGQLCKCIRISFQTQGEKQQQRDHPQQQQDHPQLLSAIEDKMPPCAMINCGHLNPESPDCCQACNLSIKGDPQGHPHQIQEKSFTESHFHKESLSHISADNFIHRAREKTVKAREQPPRDIGAPAAWKMQHRHEHIHAAPPSEHGEEIRKATVIQ